MGVVDFGAARLQLAIFLTAAVRSNDPPPLAIQMRDNAITSRFLQQRFEQLEIALEEALDPEGLIAAATEAWERLGITGAATAAWRRAARSFAALARRVLAVGELEPSALAAEILNAATRLQTEALITRDSPETGTIQLMNFHQTKGREADAVVLVYREGGFVASYREQEPFEEKSRLLYVGLTRARTRVTVVLPPNPHDLIAPFQDFE